MTHQFISILITVPDQTLAQKIGKDLVESGLVACAQIDGPIESIYKWEGVISNDVEWKLVLKAQIQHFSVIEQLILAQHPYDVPQIIALPIVEGHHAYLEWIREVTSK